MSRSSSLRIVATLAVMPLMLGVACSTAKHDTTSNASNGTTVTTAPAAATTDAAIDADADSIERDLTQLDDDLSASDSVDTEEQDPSR